MTSIVGQIGNIEHEKAPLKKMNGAYNFIIIIYAIFSTCI